MKQDKYITTLLALAALVLLASCSGISQKDAVSGDILYSDDFDQRSNEWKTWQDNSALIDYSEGGFRFYVKDSETYFWSLPDKTYTDVVVEALATKMSGPENNHYGIICRYKDDQNFYAFLISSDGYYGVVKVVQDQYELLNETGSFEYSETIRKGLSTNLLRVECNGPSLKFFVNGNQVVEFTDVSNVMGKAGLIAGTLDQPGVDVMFDNFLVIKP